jgi:hypothetical protein
MNFVRPSHIRRGLERYAETFREILESPRLPTATRVAAAAEEIKTLSLDQLRSKGRACLQSLESRYGGEKSFPDQWYEQSVAHGAYLEELTRPQLEAIAFLEYMKTALGRYPEQARKLVQVPSHAKEAMP